MFWANLGPTTERNNCRFLCQQITFWFSSRFGLGSNNPGLCLHNVFAKTTRKAFLEEGNSRSSASQSNVVSLENLPVFFSCQWLNNAVFITSSSFTGNIFHLIDIEWARRRRYTRNASNLQECILRAAVLYKYIWTGRINQVVLFSLIEWQFPQNPS